MANTNQGRIYRHSKNGKLSGPFWIDYSFRGKRHRESSGSTKVADAKRLLRKRLEEMGRGRLVGPREERLMFEDLLKTIEQDYQVNERSSARRLTSALGQVPSCV